MRCLEQLGIKMKLQVNTWSQHLERSHKGTFQMFSLGWIADYPDPQDFLDILFRTGEQNNIGNYSNPQLDSILQNASVQQDSNTRLTMYRQAEQIVVNDAAVLPLFFSQNFVLAKPNVKGYALSPLGFVALNLVSKQ